MAEEIQELLVRIKPEGAEETTDALRDAREEFEESSDAIEGSSEGMSEFASRFQGAMSAVVTGLAVASAGLLTQVPIIGGAASGLFSIIQAIAFQIDRVLRPALQPIVSGLFNVADAVFRAEGVFGDFVGVVGTVAASIGLIEGAIIGVNAILGTSFSGVLATIVGILGGPVTVAILGIIAVIGALAFAWENNLFNIRDITAEVFAVIESAFGTFVQGLREFGARARTGLELTFDLLLAAAKRWGNNFAQTIETAVNRAVRAVPEDLRNMLGLSTVNIGDPFGSVPSNEMLMQQAQTRLQGRLDRIRAPSDEERQISRLLDALGATTQETQVLLDGREIAKSQERLLGRGVSGIGRVSRGR